MSEPQDEPGTGEVGRCPACGARVRPDDSWCGLCLQPLGRTDDDGDGDHDEDGDGDGDGIGRDGARASDRADGDATAGPSLEGMDPALTDATGMDPLVGSAPASSATGSLPPGVAEAMLARLAQSSQAERPFARGPLSGVSRRGRLALAVGAAVVLAGVLVGLLALVGQLL